MGEAINQQNQNALFGQKWTLDNSKWSLVHSKWTLEHLNDLGKSKRAFSFFWFRASPMQSAGTKFKLQLWGSPLPGLPEQLGQLGSQPRLVVQKSCKRMESWSDIPLKTSLWEPLCGAPFKVTFWLVCVVNLLSFSYMPIGRTSYLTIKPCKK